MKRMSKKFLAVVFILFFPVLNAVAANNPTPKKPFPQIDLSNRMQGSSAINALGARLPEVAAWYGMSTSEFAKLLRTDPSVWLDKKARLYFVDEFPDTAESEPQGPAAAAPFPLEDTFFLNSRPGSNRVIYLDFNGHTTIGTAWNNGGEPIVSPPYSNDGDSSTFSNTELEYIQNMWRQVSEDFAPFDVNVTTQDPGQSAITRSDNNDQVYGTRVVITDDTFDDCGCGGFAYVGVFDYVGDYYKPAFVFNKGLVGAGEAISHETGHNFGLLHDGQESGSSYYQGHGSGATGWAPIMGAGYYKNLVQWSKGEYNDANQGQDDIALIQSNGALLMTDEHADIEIGATSLATAVINTNLALSGSGLISHQSDIDVFSFVAGVGNYTINVNPASFSPNLDILAQLFDSSGNIIGSSNPIGQLSASLSGTFSSGGTYFLKIDGVGEGEPLATGYSDYGSLGHYDIDGLIPNASNLQPPLAAASVSYSPGHAPLLAQFDSQGSSDSDGTIVDYEWEFGDGSTATGATTSHTYNAPGEYTATLTVTDNDGLSSNDTVNISVLNQSPIAIALVDETEGTSPLTVNFDGSDSYDQDLSGDIVSYLWDFKDGTTSTEANPTHTYSVAGDFEASLTVTDDLGASHFAMAPTVSVAAPPFVDQFAAGETAVAGTVSGAYGNTFTDNNVAQSITERESGGRKTRRYSYLEHVWHFNVQSGNAVTVFLKAWQTQSSDGDQMQFSYSVNGATYQYLAQVSNTNSNGVLMVSLPPGTAGQVDVRVLDTDRSSGNRSLDSVYVDVLYIRTHNQQGGTVPDAPMSLTASASSASQVNVDWADMSSDEYGFTIERSPAGTGNWQEIITTGSNVTSYQDSGLSAATSYSYRVAAYNAAGSSAFSGSATATTDAGSAITLSANGYKIKGVQHVDLSWSGSTDVEIYRDGQLVNSVSGSSYTDNIGAKGGGNYMYQVCEGNMTNCSNEVTIIF